MERKQAGQSRCGGRERARGARLNRIWYRRHSRKKKEAVSQGMLGVGGYFSRQHLLKEACGFRAAQSHWTAFLPLDCRAFCSQRESRTSPGASGPLPKRDECAVFCTDLDFDKSMISTGALMGHTPVVPCQPGTSENISFYWISRSRSIT